MLQKAVLWQAVGLGTALNMDEGASTIEDDSQRSMKSLSFSKSENITGTAYHHTF